MAAYWAIQRDCVYLHSDCGLCDLLAANVANKMAHVDDAKLFECMDGRANLLQVARRDRQPGSAYLGRHRAIRQLVTCPANRLSKTADDARGIWRGAVGVVRLVYIYGNRHSGLYVLVLVRIFGLGNFFGSQSRAAADRLEL